MASPYQEFARKARERFLARQQAGFSAGNQVPLAASGRSISKTHVFTRHAQSKMRQYGLSEQKVRSVIRHPKRREEGIVPHTIAVMQPPSIKHDATGKEIWSQEVWVMFQLKNASLPEPEQAGPVTQHFPRLLTPAPKTCRVISAWRYPGMSPKRHPIPEDILQEIEEAYKIGNTSELW